MRYAIITIVETDIQPTDLVTEIRSLLDFDSPSNHTDVKAIFVLTEDGKQAARYEQE